MSISLHTLSLQGTPLLLDAAVKGALLLAIAALGTLSMRRSSAALRHAVWVAAIAGLVFLPVLSVALPGWHVLPGWCDLAPEVAVSTPEENLPDEAARGAGPGTLVTAQAPPEETATFDPPAPLPPGMAEADPAGAPMPADRVAAEAPQASWPARSILPWLGGLWAIGTATFLVLLVLSQLSLWLLRRGSSQISSPLWIARVEAVSARLGLDRSVVLLGSDRRAMPMVWGVLRPKLLLPSQCDGWPERRCQAVLLHELGHVKRWDCASKLMAQAACALHWFNPLVWIAAKRMHVEAERACDDLVISSGAAPGDYAEQILEIASGCRTSPLAAHGAIAMARRSHLEGRLLAILDHRRNRRPLTPVGALVAAVLIVGVAAVVASVRAAGPAEPSQQAPQGDRGARETPSDAAPAEPPKRAKPTSGASDATAVPPGTKTAAELLRALKTAQSDAAQAEVARRLIGWGDRSIVPDLVEMLKSEDRGARCRAGRVLAALGDQRGLAAVLAELNDTGPRPTKMIRSDGKPNVPGQVQSDRYYAVHVLGEIGDRRAVPALIEALQDRLVNYKAAIVLGKLGDRRAVPPLKEMLKSDRPNERLWAGYALGKLGDPVGVPTVAAFLKDPQWTQRRHAAESLAEFADRRAVAPLIEALKDGQPEVRVSTARALGRIADGSAIAALEALLKDDAVTASGPPTAVRDAAAEAIRQIRAAAESPAAKADADRGPAGHVKLGQVIERVVAFDFTEDNAYLDLDTGKQGRRETGIDLISTAGESDTGVRTGLDMVAIPVHRKRWDDSPEVVLGEVAKGKPQRQVRLGRNELGLDDPDRVYFFKTREGGVGVLQIVPTDIQFSNVTVRYKIVHRTDGQPAWGEAAEPALRLSIRCAAQALKAGDPIPITFEITNIGIRPYRYQDRAGDRSGRMPEYALLARDAQGTQVPDPRARSGGGPGGGLSSTAALPPGQSFTKTIPLNLWALVTRPGTYQVVGTYDPQNAPAESGKIAPIRSAPISVILQPRSDGEMAAYVADLSHRLLSGDDPKDADELVRRLMYTCDRRIVPALIEAMYRDPGTGDWWAREAFRHYLPDDRQATDALLTTAMKQGMAESMFDLLRERGCTPDQIKPLVEVSLSPEHRRTWHEGAKAAMALGDDRFTPRLIAIATDAAIPAENTAREQAIRALPCHRTDEAVAVLKKLLEDPDPVVRRVTGDAIRMAYLCRDQGVRFSRPLRNDDFEAKYRQPPRGPEGPSGGDSPDGKEVLKQLKSLDAAYETAFTASGIRPGRLKKKWKLTMLDGEIVYQEQVVEIAGPVEARTGPAVPPSAPKPADDKTKPSNPRGGIKRAEYRIGEFVAFRSTFYVGPKVQAQHDWVGRIRGYGPLDPWPENSPGPATAGFLGVVKPDAPTYMLLIKRPLLSLGRGYSRYIADVKEVRREESGHLKVTADGIDLGFRVGAKWELLIDPDAAYMVRSAKMVDAKQRTTSITNSGLKRYGPRCVPEKAECKGAFIDASFEIESASPEADVEFLKRAKAAMRPPYLIHMDVHDERVTPGLYVPYDAGKTSPQGRRKDWEIGF